MPEVAPSLLDGQAPAGLWDALEGQVLAHGYTVHRGDTGRANGWTDPTSRVVRVSDAVDDAQAVKTLLHELAHIEAGHVGDLPTYATCRGRCEVEAESIAYVVATAQGMQASGYSFAYVAGWAGPDLSIVRQAADTVTRTARRILAPLDAAAAAGKDSTPADSAWGV